MKLKRDPRRSVLLLNAGSRVYYLICVLEIGIFVCFVSCLQVLDNAFI